MRTLCLDVGDRRIGVAVSDALGITAQGLETYWRTESTKKDVAYILGLLRQYAPCRLLLGLPMNMNGTLGERALKCEEFAHLLEEIGDIKVILWDERLTSVDANRILSDAGKKRKKQKMLVDAVAASLILEGYLEVRRKNQG